MVNKTQIPYTQETCTVIIVLATVLCNISYFSNTFTLILYIIGYKVRGIQHNAYFLFFTFAFDYLKYIYADDSQIQISAFLMSSRPMFTKHMLNL